MISQTLHAISARLRPKRNSIQGRDLSNALKHLRTKINCVNVNALSPGDKHVPALSTLSHHLAVSPPHSPEVTRTRLFPIYNQIQTRHCNNRLYVGMGWDIPSNTIVDTTAKNGGRESDTLV